MSDNEVPLSKAVERIEEYLAEMKNRGAITDRVFFDVHACKDDSFLFCYDAEDGIRIVDGKIVEDTPTPSGWDSLPFMKKV